MYQGSTELTSRLDAGLATVGVIVLLTASIVIQVVDWKPFSDFHQLLSLAGGQ